MKRLLKTEIMNAVFERLNEIIPTHKTDIIMNYMTDFQGLFNCLRPDEPIDMYPDETPERVECTVCEHQATREVRYLTPSGKVATMFVCDECFYEDELWETRPIVKTIHL